MKKCLILLLPSLMLLLTSCSQMTVKKHDTLNDLLCNNTPTLPLETTDDAMCFAQKTFGIESALKKVDADIDPLSWQSSVSKNPSGNWEIIIMSKDPTERTYECILTITAAGKNTSVTTQSTCGFKN